MRYVISVYDYKHPKSLKESELKQIQKSLNENNFDVSSDDIVSIWNAIYKKNLLKNRLAYVGDCRKSFHQYQLGLEVECSDVILFWRLDQVLKVTANALRLQIMNREIKNLDERLEEVLDDYSRDLNKKHLLLSGRRVELAEDLKRVKRIHLKLEEFIQALNRENQV
ncbi:dynamin-like GTPase OPA1, mitochondrial [Lycorma delicatula]|uniref:dynamin-like GTPase OPA1, mitochondrial n=1 Tax=Lycorma delicatula TaxID=130591 RepID=UPI003F512EBF